MGGLVAVLSKNSSGTVVATYIPTMDSKGSVHSLIDPDHGESQPLEVAKYSYDPYGRMMSKAGSMADSFPFGFQTKYYDPETAHYYYGFRYYDPTTCKWLNRDPLEEDGGYNLFAFVNNDPVNGVDYLGCFTGVEEALLVAGAISLYTYVFMGPLKEKIKESKENAQKGMEKGLPGLDTSDPQYAYYQSLKYQTLKGKLTAWQNLSDANQFLNNASGLAQGVLPIGGAMLNAPKALEATKTAFSTSMYMDSVTGEINPINNILEGFVPKAIEGAGAKTGTIGSGPKVVDLASGRNGIGQIDIGIMQEYLNTTPSGRIVAQELNKGSFTLTLSDLAPEGLYGFAPPSGGKAFVYVPNCKDMLTLSTKAFHEGGHALGLRNSHRAEVLLRLGELEIRGVPINREVMRQVISDVKNAELDGINPYGTLPWKLNEWSNIFNVTY